MPLKILKNHKKKGNFKMKTQIVARNMNIMSYLHLVKKEIVKNRFVSKCRFLEEHDLFQEGYLALYKAIRAYDPASGKAFEPYASAIIRNAIIDGIAEMDSSVRQPRVSKEEKEKAQGYYDQELDYWIDGKDTRAFKYKIDIDEIWEEIDIEEPVSRIETEGKLTEIQRDAHLSEKEQLVIDAKYGLGLYEKPVKTQQVAEWLNITTQSVNRIERRALSKLRAAV